MAGSRTRTRPARSAPGAGLIAGLAAVALGVAACAPAPGPAAPFTLHVVNASGAAVSVTWTGPASGGGGVDACEIGEFPFEDGRWVVAILGSADTVRFPLGVDTANGGARSRTVALDDAGRITLDARVPLDRPPCRLE